MPPASSAQQATPIPRRKDMLVGSSTCIVAGGGNRDLDITSPEGMTNGARFVLPLFLLPVISGDGRI